MTGENMKAVQNAVCLLVLLAAPRLANSQVTQPTIKDLAWIAGRWERSSPGREVVEQWLAPAGGLMIGMSRTVVGDKVREFEFLRIHQQEDGDIFYIALPSGQQEASFKLAKYAAQEAVFENPEHDFPQRIIYRVQGDSLFARIEGTVQGELKSVNFPFRRTSCRD